MVIWSYLKLKDDNYMNEYDRIECNYPIGDLFIAIQNEWTPMDVFIITDYQKIGSSCIPVGESAHVICSL